MKYVTDITCIPLALGLFPRNFAVGNCSFLLVWYEGLLSEIVEAC
jgi:hypothetical protein